MLTKHSQNNAQVAPTIKPVHGGGIWTATVTVLVASAVSEAKGIRRRGGSGRIGSLAGILLVVLANGCDPPPVEDVPISDTLVSDTLVVWRAEVDLTVGREDFESPGMIEPVPLGAGRAGDIYVLDSRLLEVQRYDSAGRYQGVLIRPGQGPGEMRSRPFGAGLGSQGVWYAEAPRGRVHFVSFDGGERKVEDTGFGFEALGARSVRIRPIRDGESERYLVEALRVDPDDRSMRPTVRASLYLSAGQELDLIYEFDLNSRDLVLDGGMSSVSFPGPSFHPIALYDDVKHQVVLVERPPEPAGTIVIQIISELGMLLEKRHLRVDTPAITAERKARIKERLLALASFGGARTVNRGLRRGLEQLVDDLPQRFPAFDEAVLGPEGTLWLRRAGLDLDGDREWLVLDEDSKPVARALVPVSASDLSFRRDGAWWAVMDAWIENPHVARLSFAAP